MVIEPLVPKNRKVAWDHRCIKMGHWNLFETRIPKKSNRKQSRAERVLRQTSSQFKRWATRTCHFVQVVQMTLSHSCVFSYVPCETWNKQSHPMHGRLATNALSVAWTCCTFLIRSWTPELSPPHSGLPHVTTDIFARIAANALCVAWICCTFRSWSWTPELSPPSSRCPYARSSIPWHSGHQRANALSVAAFGSTRTAVIVSPSWRPAACNSSSGSLKMRREDFGPCPQLPHLGALLKDKFWLRPLGNAMVTSNMVSKRLQTPAG
jgi:hypothetical protein